jgi:restriction endonuclease S subunit
MHTKITNFADIINGYSFRGAIETVKNSDIFVLQAKDIIQGENILNTNNLTPIAFTGIRTASFLQNNDIVIVSRGTGVGSFRSAIFQSDENVIASSSLMILRIKKKDILPEYVSLYFNSPDGQNKILQTVVGSYIHAISRKKFEEEIEIPIPPLEKQESLIKLNQNIKQQEKIYERKKQLKQEIINATITNLIKK